MAQSVTIAVLRERAAGETRVSATPETVKKLIALGAAVTVEAGAGVSASIADADYVAAGAQIAHDHAAKGADIVFGVQGPEVDVLAGANPGAWVVAGLDPFGRRDRVEAYAAGGLEALAMEFMPRITRAQSMDILSSQANLAGYKSVLIAANLYGRAFPMMMTAAGTVSAAKAFVSPDCRPLPPRGVWVRKCPRPTCVPPPKNRSSRWAPSRSLSKTWLGSKAKAQAAMPPK